MHDRDVSEEQAIDILKKIRGDMMPVQNTTKQIDVNEVVKQVEEQPKEDVSG